MPLLSSSEITVENLMADLPILRHAHERFAMQVLTLREGLTLTDTPVLRRNPTRDYVVMDGDTLHVVSVRLFGSPDYAARIAEVNDIGFPFSLVAGQVLSIPDIAAIPQDVS